MSSCTTKKLIYRVYPEETDQSSAYRPKLYQPSYAFDGDASTLVHTDKTNALKGGIEWIYGKFSHPICPYNITIINGKWIGILVGSMELK